MLENFVLNPAVLSIILLSILCLCRINVLLAIFISSLFAGLMSSQSLDSIMHTFIAGMGGNSETGLSYILLGVFAAVMTHTGLSSLIAQKVIKIAKGKAFILLSIICTITIISETLIPIHIAFIPILIPALIPLMNMLNLDRRGVASLLTFGLKMPYILAPVGYGLIFHNLLADNMTQNGVSIHCSEIWKSTWILAVGMIVGVLVAILITYRKPRKYENIDIGIEQSTEVKFNKKHVITIIAAIATFAVQITTHSLPLGALVGLGIVFAFRAVEHSKMDKLMNDGINLMGYVAFVMFVASGFANVLKSTGSIDHLVNYIITILPSNLLMTAFILLILGLIITMGIGTSFGTIPILAVVFVPLCTKMGFNVSQIVVIFAAAAALGDAGSPASDTTLGPTTGLNMDGQHDHIWDTCVPTFLHFNTALIISALIGVAIFN